MPLSQGFLSLLKEKFSGGSRGGGGRDHPPSVEAGGDQPLSLETSPSATPEMVRRRRFETGTEDNNEISCPRRTSTPEIVRIRTTEAVAAAGGACGGGGRTEASAGVGGAMGSTNCRGEDALNTTVSESPHTGHSSGGQADVVRHGLGAHGSGGLGGKNSEIVGCDQEEARGGGRRPASGAEVVRYKVEHPRGHQLPTASDSSGSLEKKSSGCGSNAKKQNISTASDKDIKQQMPLRHQVSLFCLSNKSAGLKCLSGIAVTH